MGNSIRTNDEFSVRNQKNKEKFNATDEETLTDKNLAIETQDNISKRINFSDSVLFPDVANAREKMESLRRFDDDTTRLFKVSLRKKHIKNRRYKKPKLANQGFDFDDRSNSPDIFYTKEQQLKQFVKLNNKIDKRARSNFRSVNSPLSFLKQTTDKQELKNQMRLLENELFRC